MAKYEPLRRCLEATTGRELPLAFEEISRLVGGLPPSAYNHAAWWGNEAQGTHTHAHAWMEAGWRVAAVNLAARQVRFVRAGGEIKHSVAPKPAGAPRLAVAQGAQAPDVAPQGIRAMTGAPQDTLILIPCSKSKAKTDELVAPEKTIRRDLPDDLARRLADARAANRARAGIDERTLLPAWRRYTGFLYQQAAPAIGQAMAEGSHILVISGGYGIVRADEPIGLYDAVFNPSWWPGSLIEDCLLHYASRHGLTRVVALAGGSTQYAGVARRTSWRRGGVDSAVLLAPEVHGGGSMNKVPSVIGEVLITLLHDGLQADWRSSKGIGLQAERLV